MFSLDIKKNMGSQSKFITKHIVWNFIVENPDKDGFS